MRARYPAWALAAALSLGVHVEGAAAQEPGLTDAEASLLGCYQLEFDSGFTDRVAGDVPATVALLGTRRRFGVWRELVPPIPARWREKRGFWRLQPDGGIRIVWSDGHSGILIVARLTPQGFDGAARTLIDVIGAESLEGAVRGTRTPCPGHLPGAADPGR